MLWPWLQRPFFGFWTRRVPAGNRFGLHLLLLDLFLGWLLHRERRGLKGSGGFDQTRTSTQIVRHADRVGFTAGSSARPGSYLDG